MPTVGGTTRLVRKLAVEPFEKAEQIQNFIEKYRKMDFTYRAHGARRSVYTSGPDQQACPLTGIFDGQTSKLPESPPSEITELVPGSWSFYPARRKITS
ncbi:hypothetical protein E2C01_017276 [Portunus trituberculatus]|uniref:Uncharacterized protein n=1 Tax=Portunus trituberculatus TaxID=210409 RepID=A0A5B7DRX5_PORTR|nr:hypothetical protein [Portunus trituberculatus]